MGQLSFLNDTITVDPVDWIANRDARLAHLEAFVPRAGNTYARSRNFDLSPSDRSNISCLSPWLRHRLLLEQEVIMATLAIHSFSATEKFIQEVFWRGYFKGWLEQRPQVWASYKSELQRALNLMSTEPSLRSRYEEAIKGQTGIECFDTWVHELAATGYLHNHARMWFASIWIFTLQLPWQLGADFFLRHLLDGDPASNTLSWRWVGGLHTKGKTYLATPSNIARFTNGRFNPSGQLAKLASPLDFDAPGSVLPLPPAGSLPQELPYGLLITEEDCNPQISRLGHRPALVMGLTATTRRSPLTIGDLARSFAQGAVGDAVARTAEHF